MSLDVALPVRLGADDIAAALGQPRPTDEQRAIIESPLQPLLVVAGAGSGKTETMAARVVWLVANGLVTPERVLGLTFTRRAAAELAARVRRRLAALRAEGLDLPAPPAGAAPWGPGVGGPGDGLLVGPGDEEPGEPTVATYHSYAGGVVADHGLRLGVDPGALLVGEAAAYQIAAEVVEGWDDLGDLDAAPSTVVQAVLTLAGECAEHLVDLDDVEAHLSALVDGVRSLPGRQPAPVRDACAALDDRRRLLPLVRRYTEVKAEREVLDFGDQVALAARLAEQAPQVAALERARFGVVLLDEYQDTSHAQLVLLRRLFGDGHPVTAVGDPHQSIYGWRGASAGGLEAFPEHFPLWAPPPPPGRAPRPVPAPVLALSTSWRNDVAVLDAANLLAAPLRARSALEVPQLRARPDAGRGRVLAAFAQSAAEEAEQVADAVASVWHADALLPPEERRTTAVLCRKRSQLEALEGALRSRGLPVEVVGVGGLLSRPEVVDVVAALRVVHDPGRGDALLRLLTGARWRLGVSDLDVLDAWSRASAGPGGDRGAARRGGRPPVVADAADGSSLVAALDALPPPGWVAPSGRALSTRGRERLADAAAVLHGLRRSAGAPLPELVLEAERALGLDVELAARPGVAPETARAHLEALVEVAEGFAEAGTGAAGRASLGGFLAWLDAAEARERGLAPGEEDDDPGAGAGSVRPAAGRVQLLTVHAAKGLEWDVVAVPGLVERTFPAGGATSSGWLAGLGSLPYALRGDRASLPDLGWESAVDGPDAGARRAAFLAACGAHELAEERRLAYVAATRARSLLLLCGAWWAGTGKRPREPSRFLREVVEGGAASGGPLPVAPEQPENPLLASAPTAVWPADPVGGAREALERAAAMVDRARARRTGGSPPEGRAVAAEGWALEVDRLLAERDGAAGTARGPGRLAVALPAHLSASRLVELAADPAALALAVRRPVPTAPHPAARRGTAFHAWLEERFRADTLVDLDDIPGASDEDAAADDRLEQLQAAFLASEWAERNPLAVEVDLETVVAGLVVRCRVDAVFPARSGPPGAVDVVDWKSGAPPTGERARHAAVQLAVYRLAWSRLHGVALRHVGAAFFYAATGQTRRPADLLDEAGLEALVTGLPPAP